MNNNPMTVKKLADSLAYVLIGLILLSVISVTGFFSSIQLGLGETVSESNIFTEEQVTELEIELVSADINILKGDSIKIDSTKNCFRVNNRNGKLTIEERNALFSRDESRQLTIYLPEDFLLKKTDIDTGAGDIKAESLRTEYLALDIGAGKTTFDNLEVTKETEIDCGAGVFTLKKGSLHNLEFDLGVGKADISAYILANAEIESGVGQLELNLSGGKEAYSIAIEKGIGIFTVDSKLVSESIIGNGENKLKIEGGVGNISVTFND